MENFHIIFIFILIIIVLWLFSQINNSKQNVGRWYDLCCGESTYYWKTHPNRWPENIYPYSNFFDSGKTWIKALKRYPNHKLYYILAKQYITISLNESIGCDYPHHFDDIKQATIFFETYTPNTSKNITMIERSKYIKISQRLKCASDCLKRFNGNI